MQNAIRMFIKPTRSVVASVSLRGGMIDGDNAACSGSGRDMKYVIRDGVCYVRLGAIAKYAATKAQSKK